MTLVRCALLFLMALLAFPCACQNLPVIDHYDLDITLQPSESTYKGHARMRITNPTTAPLRDIPFLLYRLVRVTYASSGDGKRLAFQQELASMSDEPDWQVNRVVVHLAQPLASNASTDIVLTYGGSIWGYREVMRYVRDQIDDNYALLRAETLAYPIAASPSYTGWLTALNHLFSYRIRTTVPADWVVACGDSRHSRTDAGSQAVFECESDIPRQQIQVAAARFQVIEGDGLRIYALPQDSEAARRVLGGLKRARAYFGSYFERPADGPFTVIEIPEGWGSQASRGYCIQTPDAFRDPAQMRQLYHEVAHGWNAQTAGTVQRTRYFDEAFANYFAALAIREFVGPDAFDSEMERLRASFATQAKRDPRYLRLPVSQWGGQEMGGASYTKGAWSLYVLNRLLGDDVFQKAMRTFLDQYTSKPADFPAFQASVEASSGRPLKLFFDRWIYGLESSSDLIDGKSVAQMVSAVKQ